MFVDLFLVNAYPRRKLEVGGRRSLLHPGGDADAAMEHSDTSELTRSYHCNVDLEGPQTGAGDFGGNLNGCFGKGEVRICAAIFCALTVLLNSRVNRRRVDHISVRGRSGGQR